MTRAGPRGNRDPGGDVRAVRYTLNTCDDILTTTRDNNNCRNTFPADSVTPAVSALIAVILDSLITASTRMFKS
ncbi:hypothetical protein AFLA_010908 [Aspergillus flavus NRRL3357]|nr:hypothetical protein AFLA_010908 [Aspergillus flavus NRRL3357]